MWNCQRASLNMLNRPFSSLIHHRKFLFYCGLCFISILILLHFTQKSFYIPSSFFSSKGNKIVVFNRIPKTGSTSVVRIFESLSARNNFRVYRLAIFNPFQFLNPLEHKAFINEISSISRYTNLLVHGHFYHLNFNRFGIGHDYVYINILRDPLDRLVSKYYFIRFGDDHRPNTHRRRMTNDTLQHQTFDACVETFGGDCNPKLLWVQVKFKFNWLSCLHFCTNFYFFSLLDTVLLRFLILLSHSWQPWGSRVRQTSPCGGLSTCRGSWVLQRVHGAPIKSPTQLPQRNWGYQKSPNRRPSNVAST